jgi:hypothetical protein
MKKLLVLLAAIAVMFPARAQDDDKFDFGLKLGVSFAFKKFDMKPDNTTPLYGPVGGIFGEININNYLAIRPEINFGSQGLRSKAEAGDTKVIMTTGLGYLQFPVLAKGSYGNDKISGFVNFGPQFGAGLFAAGRTKTIIDGERDSEKIEVTFDDLNFKRFDAGLAIGLGMECEKTGLQVEGRYYAGMADIQDWGDMGRPDGYKKTTNSAFHFTIGWTF